MCSNCQGLRVPMKGISHLPDELVLQCLVRVPYESYKNVRAACKNWEAMLSNPKFYAERKIRGHSEQFICLIQSKKVRDVNGEYERRVDGITICDPVKGSRERLPFITDPHCSEIPKACQCISVNRKLLLIGGFHPSNTTVMKSVYIYDFESARWSRGADMPTARSFFACSVSPSTGLIYVAGGHDRHGNPLRSAESYNVQENKWEILPEMTQQRDGCQGIFMDGKFIVLNGRMLHNPGKGSSEVFDPSTGTWRKWEHMWNFGGPYDSCVVASSSGELFSFNNQQVRKYDSEKNVWTAVASFPTYIRYFECATQWRDWIFVSMQQICYLFHPSTCQWIAVDIGEDFALSAATLEI